MKKGQIFSSDSPSKYFRNATIGDLEDSGDVARSGSLMSEFNNLLSSGVRQWSPIDIHSSQLIDPTVTCIRNIINNDHIPLIRDCYHL